MGEILLTTLGDALGGAVPVNASVTAVASRVRTDGAEVTAPATVRVHVRDGVPDAPFVLDASGPDWYWTLTIRFANIARSVVRHVSVPEGVVEWAALVDIDPATYQPADPTPTLLDTINAQVEAYMVEHPVDASVGVVPLSVSGPVTVPVVNGWSYELTATDAAAVTLDGTPGTQVAIRWSGTSGTVEGQSVSDGQTWVAVLWVSGWVLYEVGGSGGGGGDTTPPVPGTLAASAVAATSFTLTVSGASDAGSGLHAQPFRFSTDGGSTWSSWQASPSLIVSDMTAATTYQCQHQVRDAAANVASGVVVPVTTTATVVSMVATFQDSHVDPAGAASYTWEDAALGAASGSRRVIVGLVWRGTTPQAALPNVTVGGVTASRIGSNGSTGVNGSNGQMFFSAAVPTGTTGDVVVTFGAAVLRVGMAAWTAGKTPTFVQQHNVDSVSSTSTTLTTAATAEQAVLGMSFLLGDPQTASPVAYDAQDTLGAPGPGTFKFMAWHRNGASLSQTVESSFASGVALQVTFS